MSTLPIQVIPPGSPPHFNNPALALREPNGLLAVGGDLSVERLLEAYRQGIFPWFGEDEPILWWSPDPRCVFDTGALHVSRSLRRQLLRSNWTLSLDRDFGAVIRACAAPREGQPGTWIVTPMIEAYERLHRLGHAHSVEVWNGEVLVGGIYGVTVGRLFCGESMFSRESGGSKAALLGLCRWLHDWGFPLLDAQVSNPHLLSLGARLMPRSAFLQAVRELGGQVPTDQAWHRPGLTPACTLAG
jgi:leucyl/phenylalanyl-tRNA--protein transferase